MKRAHQEEGVAEVPRKAQPPQAYLARLPSDIIVHIISARLDRVDRAVCAQVCVRLRALVHVVAPPVIALLRRQWFAALISECVTRDNLGGLSALAGNVSLSVKLTRIEPGSPRLIGLHGSVRILKALLDADGLPFDWDTIRREACNAGHVHVLDLLWAHKELRVRWERVPVEGAAHLSVMRWASAHGLIRQDCTFANAVTKKGGKHGASDVLQYLFEAHGITPVHDALMGLASRNDAAGLSWAFQVAGAQPNLDMLRAALAAGAPAAYEVIDAALKTIRQRAVELGEFTDAARSHNTAMLDAVWRAAGKPTLPSEALKEASAVGDVAMLDYIFRHPACPAVIDWTAVWREAGTGMQWTVYDQVTRARQEIRAWIDRVRANE